MCEKAISKKQQRQQRNKAMLERIQKIKQRMFLLDRMRASRPRPSILDDRQRRQERKLLKQKERQRTAIRNTLRHIIHTYRPSFITIDPSLRRLCEETRERNRRDGTQLRVFLKFQVTLIRLNRGRSCSDKADEKTPEKDPADGDRQ